MQAKRKTVDPILLLSDAIRETEDWAPSSAPGAVTSQSSPAHLMLRGLAARLTEPTTGAGPVAVAAPVEDKWPMPARLGAIVGLALLGWAALYVVAVSIL